MCQTSILVAGSQLNKRLCPSRGPSVGRPVCKNMHFRCFKVVDQTITIHIHIPSTSTSHPHPILQTRVIFVDSPTLAYTNSIMISISTNFQLARSLALSHAFLRSYNILSKNNLRHPGLGRRRCHYVPDLIIEALSLLLARGKKKMRIKLNGF